MKPRDLSHKSIRRMIRISSPGNPYPTKTPCHAVRTLVRESGTTSVAAASAPTPTQPYNHVTTHRAVQAVQAVASQGIKVRHKDKRWRVRLFTSASPVYLVSMPGTHPWSERRRSLFSSNVDDADKLPTYSAPCCFPSLLDLSC